MNFLQRMTIKMQQFMAGRYGNDRFTLFLSIAGMLIYCFGNVLRWFRSTYIVGIIVCLVGTLMLYYGIFRAFSKNYPARQKELNLYLRLSEKPRAGLRLLVNKIRDRKTHRYFKCENCKTVMRVPKGRGKIEITCPKCRVKTVKKT